MKIEQILDTKESVVRAVFVSSYIPRKCGIATFTKDLTTAMNDLNPEALVDIVAVDNGEVDEYPWEVKFKIDHHNLDEYFRAAEYLNQSSADIVCLQHEFGLFGGPDGDYIFSFLRSLNKPIIITLHTVLLNPTDSQKSTMQRLADLSKYLVVMIGAARDRLCNIYGIDPNKVVVINHGVVDKPRQSRIGNKILPWRGKRVLLVSGLINKDKGINYIIKAMPAILKKFPETILAVVGQTHPEIKKQEGELYRNSLKNLARQVGVAQSVKFVNEYLPLEKLLRYYESSDICLTPHLNPEQASSGTLAYGLGMGKVCISTPYLYAKEMLSNENGILVDFKNSEEIGEAVLRVFGNPELQENFSKRAYEIGRRMSWPRIGQRYLNLFRFIINHEENSPETS